MARAASSFALVLGILLVVGGLAGASLSYVPSATNQAGSVHETITLTVSYSFNPTTVNVNNPTQGSYSITGGTSPFTVWVNNTPPGCGPQTNPFTSSSASSQFTCTPTSSGTYNVHLDVTDNVGNRGSASATLTVNSGSGNGGNGNGNGTGSSGGFSLPPELMSMMLLFGAVFIGAIVALAAGVIVMAVLLSRRLRQLNETMSRSSPPPGEEKPPT